MPPVSAGLATPSGCLNGPASGLAHLTAARNFPDGPPRDCSSPATLLPLPPASPIQLVPRHCLLGLIARRGASRIGCWSFCFPIRACFCTLRRVAGCVRCPPTRRRSDLLEARSLACERLKKTSRWPSTSCLQPLRARHSRLRSRQARRPLQAAYSALLPAVAPTRRPLHRLQRIQPSSAIAASRPPLRPTTRPIHR